MPFRRPAEDHPRKGSTDMLDTNVGASRESSRRGCLGALIRAGRLETL